MLIESNLAKFLQHFLLFCLQLLVGLQHRLFGTLSLLSFFILFTHGCANWHEIKGGNSQIICFTDRLCLSVYVEECLQIAKEESVVECRLPRTCVDMERKIHTNASVINRIAFLGEPVAFSTLCGFTL